MFKTRSSLFLSFVFLLIVGAIIGDRLYLNRFLKEYNRVQKEWIVTSNKLATAKIVHENLNHVQELVFQNMEFPGRTDSISHQSRFFDFVTSCINDLKLTLVALTPLPPAKKGKTTTYGYDITMVGDFFSIGELCARFENSRRIISLETFEVKEPTTKSNASSSRRKGREVEVNMRVHTYRVKKS